MKKKVYYTTDKQLDGLRWTAKIVNFGVSIMVKAAINELCTAYVMLRERKDLFRHGVKYHANMAMNKAERKEREIFALMTHEKFYDDYSDSVIDYAQNDITMFRIAVKQELDNNKVENSDLFSQMETARTLLDMCCKQFKNVMEDSRKNYSIDLSADFKEFYVYDIYFSWNNVCNAVFDSQSKGKVVDINTENVIRLFGKLYSNFVDGCYIEKCMKVAHERNPDFIKNEIEVVS